MDPIDLLSAKNIQDPYPVYQSLRETEPVYWSDRMQGWLLTRAEDVKAGLEDARFSANRTHLFAQHQLRGLNPDILKDYLRLSSSMIVMKDGADHRRLRAEEDRALCPAHVDRWSPAAQRIVSSLLDRVQKQRSMELVADVSEPLPTLLLAELLDIPPGDRTRFQQWAEDATAFFAVTPSNVEVVARRANDAVIQLEAYIVRIITERMQRPGDDLISLFIERRGSGDITREELVANCVHMLIVGQMTSIAQFSNGVYELLRHPNAVRRLRADPALFPRAIDECIRYSPAVHFTHRIALEDVQIRDKVIPKGQIAFFGIASASRDPSVFPDPDRFDIDRAPGRHFSFGMGPHACAGAALGRRELEVGYQALFERFPELRFDEGAPPQRRATGITFRGFARLPLHF
jgi:cytochrome P450 PksS